MGPDQVCVEKTQRQLYLPKIFTFSGHPPRAATAKTPAAAPRSAGPTKKSLHQHLHPRPRFTQLLHKLLHPRARFTQLLHIHLHPRVQATQLPAWRLHPRATAT